MHELPLTAWILIICSTLPWLIVTAIYFVHNTRGHRPTRSPRERG